MYVFRNPNPLKKVVGDCVIRAISIILDQPWETTYLEITSIGLNMCDMPSSNEVWDKYLSYVGYHRHIVPDMCPECVTVKDFCRQNSRGKYILATGDHLIAVIDGDHYDIYDSENEVPIFYYSKGERL